MLHVTVTEALINVYAVSKHSVQHFSLYTRLQITNDVSQLNQTINLDW